MTDQEDNINVGKIVFDDNQNRFPVWGKPFPDLCVFVLTFCHSVDNLWLLSENSCQKLVTNELFGRECFVLQQDTFHPHQDYEQVVFYKKSSLCIPTRSV